MVTATKNYVTLKTALEETRKGVTYVDVVKSGTVAIYLEQTMAKATNASNNALPLHSKPLVLSNGTGVSLPLSEIVCTTEQLYVSSDNYRFDKTKPTVLSELTWSLTYRESPSITTNSSATGTLQILEREEKKLEERPPIEIIGDNLDVQVDSTRRTLHNRKKDWHWFLMLATVKRIYDRTLPDEKPKEDILNVECIKFLPSVEDGVEYQKCVDFHIAKTLLKYIPFLDFLVEIYPTYIPHSHLEETSRKTVFKNMDLLEANENSTQGMIQIMQHIHQTSVPSFVKDNKKCVAERTVFGGDVLTCERGLGAQEAMDNSDDDYDQLRGVIYRPEGLHRVMNFVKVILLKLRWDCFCYILFCVMFY